MIKLSLQPGLYPINAFPKSLDENGILFDVKKLFQSINESFKKYALPECPLTSLLFLIPLASLILLASLLDEVPGVFIIIEFVFVAVLYMILNWFMNQKRKSGIKAAIKEFNQTLMSKRIWAEWNSDYNLVGENDGETNYEDQYTINDNCRGCRRALQPVLFIKKRENVLSSGFEANYPIPTAPQLPYQVV